MKIQATLFVSLFAFVNSHTVEVDIDEAVRHLQDREVTLSELEGHNSVDVDVWVALEGIVYDLSGFTHPGGLNHLLEAAGMEADDLYNSVSTKDHFLSIQDVVTYPGIVRVGPLVAPSPVAPVAPVASSAPVVSGAPVVSEAPVVSDAPVVLATSAAPQSVAPVVSDTTPTTTPLVLNFTSGAPVSGAPVVADSGSQSPAAAPPSSPTSPPTSGGVSVYGSSSTIQVIMTVLTISCAFQSLL